MGVKISFQGQLSDLGRIDEMVDEIHTFAEHMKWQNWTMPELLEQGHVKDMGPEARLRGISVSVDPHSEEVHFHVDAQGRFVNHRYHQLLHSDEERREFVLMMRASSRLLRPDPTAEPPETSEHSPALLAFFRKGLLYNWVTTQHGGPAAHVQVCSLIRFVRDRFAPALQVKDDTGYFEHGRLEAVEREMGQVDQTIRFMRRAVNRINDEGSVFDLQELLGKLQRYMHEESKMMD